MTEQPNRTTALTRRRRWGRRLGVTVGVILALMAIVLLWVATLDINDYRPRIEREIAARTGVPVTLGNMSLGLWPRIAIQASDVSFGGPSAQWMQLGQLSVTLSWSSLLTGKPEFNQLRLSELSVELIREQDGGWNIDPLLDQLGASERDASDEPSELRINQLWVVDSRISLTDASSGLGIQASEWQLEVRDFGRRPFKLITDARLRSPGSMLEADVGLTLETDWPDGIRTTVDRLDLRLMHASAQPDVVLGLQAPARLDADWRLTVPQWHLSRQGSTISGAIRTAPLHEFDPRSLLDFEAEVLLELEGSVLPQQLRIAPQASLEGSVAVSNDQGQLRLITEQMKLDDAPVQVDLSVSLLDAHTRVNATVDRLDLRTLLRSPDPASESTPQWRSDTINLQWLEPIVAEIRVRELIHADGQVSNLNLTLNLPDNCADPGPCSDLTAN